MEVLHRNIHNDLIEQCRSGDRTAQVKIYKLYYKAMFNTSYRIVKNRPEAEDIMQEAFLTAFQKLDSYNESATFGAWLKRIVVNKSIDSLKKNKYLNGVDFMEFEETLMGDEGMDSEDLKIDTSSLELIHTCIKELPERYRIILSLYMLEGYDHEEIASILNITSSTSRSQFTRAKRKLIQLILSKKNDTISGRYH